MRIRIIYQQGIRRATEVQMAHLTIDQLKSDGSLYEYLYHDGVAWGIGTAEEAREAVTYCGEPADQIRYAQVSA